MSEEEENGSSRMSFDDGGASSIMSTSGGEEGPEDLAKRRGKNRVNARRSRERKRLMLDTLQQEHWQLHQENKRIQLENDKLREAIASIKTLQGGDGAPNSLPSTSAPSSIGINSTGLPAATNVPISSQNGAAGIPAPGSSTVVNSGVSSAPFSGVGNMPNGNANGMLSQFQMPQQEQSASASQQQQQINSLMNMTAQQQQFGQNPLMGLLAQQLLMQQSTNIGGGLNPMVMQLLLAQSLQQQQHSLPQTVQGAPQNGTNPALTPAMMAMMGGGSSNAAGNHNIGLGPMMAQHDKTVPVPTQGQNMGAQPQKSQAPNATSNFDFSSQSGGANLNLAALLQQLGGGAGATNTIQNATNTADNKGMHSGASGLSTLLQALGNKTSIDNQQRVPGGGNMSFATASNQLTQTAPQSSQQDA